ncbi:hypothetical protein H4R99_001146 [Coemansia sp. RSA 1722]|nr:hypothetical protein GGF39_000573 [Coemansia sp. RSA 1721]KAJ2605417.1 hypothetical protein H4R99_001146 [Coemansia sp. RSA 1722]KAJ2640254.1 hypothetical protein GGF40_000153 [Coemansia sp. RSA 1286]
MTDPLHLIVQCLVSDTPLTAAFGSSSDVRATLRLFDPTYINTLSAVHSRRHQIKHKQTEPNYIHRTSVLEKLLSEQPSPQKHALLADCLDHIDDSEIIAKVNEMVLERLFVTIEAGQEVDKGLCLLFAAAKVPLGPWLGHLVEVICDAILELDAGGRCAQLLCLLALTVEHYEETLDLMASLHSLRQLARHIIKLLSESHPVVAASALHLLTRLLLPPLSYTLVANSPLAMLSSSLRGKLFDQSHIGRTMQLAADLCRNCTGQDPSELLVLDAVAGTVSCVAAHGGDEYLALFQLLDLAPAIHQLVTLARENRRYLHPLLRILNSLLAMPTNVDLPLIRALTRDSGGEDSTGSAAAEVFDIVLSGVEDALNTMPVFGTGRIWPPVCSSESAGGWLVSCNKEQRTQLTVFLANALDLVCSYEHGYGSSDVVCCEELVDAIGRVVEFGVANAKREQGDAAGFLGSYYWAVRPVLEIAGELVERSEMFTRRWSAWIEGSELVNMWVAGICASVVNEPHMLLAEAMRRDLVAATLNQGTNTDLSSDGLGSAGLQTNTPLSRASLESDAPKTATVVSAHKDQMDASDSPNHAPMDADTRRQLLICDKVQVVAQGQWARVIEVHMAVILMLTVSSSKKDARIPQLQVTLKHASQDLRALSASSLRHLFICVSELHGQYQRHEETIAMLESQNRKQVTEHMVYQQTTAAQLSTLRNQLESFSGLADQLTNVQQAAKQQQQIYEALVDEYARNERDLEEWKRECMETRQVLDQTRREVDGLRETSERDANAFLKYREESNRTECALRSTVSQLEQALGEAVARLRVMEIQAMAERNVSEEMRAKNISMASRLAEYSKIAESLYGLASNSKHSG